MNGFVQKFRARYLVRLLILLCTSVVIFLCLRCMCVLSVTLPLEEVDNPVLYLNQRANNSLLNFQDFEYFLKNNVCCNRDVFLVIIIHSAPDHFDNRNTIRSTFGKVDNHLVPNLRVAFMLAKPRTAKLQEEIVGENERYSDIIQGNFVDSYRNLTYKHVMGLRWVAHHCGQARYVMKMDDDIFVNIFELMHLLQTALSSMKNQIACYFQHGMSVVRDPTSKWFVSVHEYKESNFCDYCSGWAYITTPDVANQLQETASRFPYFWVDDVHITGTVAKKAEVKLSRFMNRYFSLDSKGLSLWLKSGSNRKFDKIFAPTWGDLELMKRAHLKSEECHVSNCSCCFREDKLFRSIIRKQPTGKSLVKFIG